MKKPLAFAILITSLGTSLVTAQTTLNPTAGAMSKTYWELWNPDVQARIDKDIEQNRKADVILKITDLPAGAEIIHRAPVNLSEITITSPNNDELGRVIQVTMARNLYRINTFKYGQLIYNPTQLKRLRRKNATLS